MFVGRLGGLAGQDPEKDRLVRDPDGLSVGLNLQKDVVLDRLRWLSFNLRRILHCGGQTTVASGTAFAEWAAQTAAVSRPETIVHESSC